MTTPLPTFDGMLRHGDDEATLRRHISASSRVAVIGSSGNLLHRRRGATIDAHDVVVRVNAHRLEGLEQDVGARTHVHVTSSLGLANARPLLSANELLVHVTIASWESDGAFAEQGFDVVAVANSWSSALANVQVRHQPMDALCGRSPRAQVRIRSCVELTMCALSVNVRACVCVSHWQLGGARVIADDGSDEGAA